MSRLPPRLLLMIATTVVFVVVLIRVRPGFSDADGALAMIGSAAAFWIAFIVGTILAGIAYAVFALVSGVPKSQIGLKDERDIATGNRAYAVGFWILFAGGFVTILSVGSDHNQMLSAAILTQVVAVGAILAIGLFDEIRTTALSLRLDD